MKPNKTYFDLDFSFERNLVTEDVAKKVDNSAIKQSLRNLLLMNKYDCPFHPERGSQVYNQLFDLFTPVTSASIKRTIAYTINNFEPRISLINVDVTPNEDNQRLIISLTYEILSVGTIHTYDFVIDRLR